MAAPQTLQDLASIIRSKNAGPYRLTMDILLRDEDRFRHVVQTGTVTRESVARAYGMPLDHVTSLFVVPAGRAIKVTLLRPVAQGDYGESDMYGCQQHVPLMTLRIEREML